jgi:hypothetical protein
MSTEIKKEIQLEIAHVLFTRFVSVLWESFTGSWVAARIENAAAQKRRAIKARRIKNPNGGNRFLS